MGTGGGGGGGGRGNRKEERKQTCDYSQILLAAAAVRLLVFVCSDGLIWKTRAHTHTTQIH